MTGPLILCGLAFTLAAYISGWDTRAETPDLTDTFGLLEQI